MSCYILELINDQLIASQLNNETFINSSLAIITGTNAIPGTPSFPSHITQFTLILPTKYSIYAYAYDWSGGVLFANL